MDTKHKADESKQGFLKLMRSPETKELLLNDPLAFALLANIALRARWRAKFDVRGLNFGQAMVGDYKKIGFSRKQYRTRLKRLVEYGLLTTRPTYRGTIATLTTTDVFNLGLTSDANATGANCFAKNAKKGPTVLPMKSGSKGPTGGPLTKKERKKYKNDDNTLREVKHTPWGQHRPSSSLLNFLSLEEAEKHPLWSEFEAYCRSRPNGSPTLKGFNTWLPKQSQPKHAGLPIAKRNKLINGLNERKARIIRTFPDGRYEPWATEELAKIQRALEKL
jgi:hypothetical protein